MVDLARSESRSAIPNIARVGLRTSADRRPPRTRANAHTQSASASRTI
jgi:hypothetical protein